MPNDLHKYAFDVKMAVIIRVTAKSEAEALEIIDGIDMVSIDFAGDNYCITEASVEDTSPHLFERDGLDLE
jgi:predicted HAD superfamily phosphohydrolase